MFTCEIGNEKIIEKLVKLRADINKENGFGITPLVHACETENEDMVDKTIALGADINEENEFRVTPLSYAKKNGNKTIIKKIENIIINNTINS